MVQFPRIPKELMIPSVARPLVDEIASEPLRSVDDLREEVKTYMKVVTTAAISNPVVDTNTAAQLEVGCLALLDHLEGQPDGVCHLLVQVACRYFILEEDAEGDLDSAIGFDDDAEVYNAVCQYLGRPDLLVEI